MSCHSTFILYVPSPRNIGQIKPDRGQSQFSTLLPILVSFNILPSAMSKLYVPQTWLKVGDCIVNLKRKINNLYFKKLVLAH